MRPTERRGCLPAGLRAGCQEREGLGTSQEELGFPRELDRTCISGIERGGRNPTLATVRPIATALDVKPSKLVRGAER